MTRTRQRLDAWDAAALVVATAISLLYAREIGNDFLWGHDGGNGAPFWNAAENSMRFGVIGQVKDYNDLAPPPAAAFNTHHPLLLHFHLVVVRALFGRMEWVGRLVPFLYSAATLALLYRTARRLYTPSFALAALVLYGLTPLHLIFATMINHEQGGIFWALLTGYGAVRWLVAGRRRHAVLVVIAGTLALQFAWSSYFVLAVAGALTLIAWLRSEPGGRPRQRARALAGLLLGTALANLGAFFAMIRATKGSFGDMESALAHRSSEVEGYGGATVERALDLYGPLLLGLAAAGLTRMVSRARGGRWRTRDMLVVSFLLGQVAVSLVFRNAGRIHSYWTYYGGVACALLGAEVVVSAVSWLRRRTSKAGVAAVVASVLALQTSFALGRQSWGLASGHAAYTAGFTDQFEEVQLAKWLNARHGRDVTYMLHASLNARTEIFYYLDAPHVGVELLASEPERCATRSCVLVVDLRRIKDGVTLSTLSGLVASHPTAIFGAHLLVVDLGGKAEEPRAYRLDVKSAGAVHDWFVNGRHGRAEWVAVDSAKEQLASALRDLAIPSYIAESSKNGRALGEPCGKGFAVVGLVSKEHEGVVVAVRAICGRGEEREKTAWMGDASRGNDVEVSCAAGQAVVGLHMPSTADLGKVSLACSVPIDTSTGETLACPDGMVAISVHARREEAIVGIGIGCRAP